MGVVVGGGTAVGAKVGRTESVATVSRAGDWVVTAVGGQLIEPLFALNTFVLLLLGILLVGLGIALERRLDKVREFSKELRAKMEHWE